MIIHKETDHIVLLSGGLGSFETARRVVNKFGKERTHLWFFDTLIEDEDLYRFLNDIEKVLEIKITRFVDGRTPWDVFNDERFIGNSRVDLCSKHLKRLFLERELRKQYPKKENVILYFGIDWTEEHRIKVMKPKWNQKNYYIDFPLLWEPWLLYNDYKNITESLGISVPRLYKLGFLHNNCGGACIKAGFKQWTLLYQNFPERYLWHEQKEREFRKNIGKDVSILRSRKGGITKPFTLEELRLRIERKNNFQEDNFQDIVDDSSCSCFVNIED